MFIKKSKEEKILISLYLVALIIWITVVILGQGCTPSKDVTTNKEYIEAVWDTDADFVTIQHRQGSVWVDDTTLNISTGKVVILLRGNEYRLKAFKDKEIDFSKIIFVK